MDFLGFPHRIGTIAVVVALAPCAGCWEEIHYQPPAAEPPTQASAADPEQGGQVPGDETSLAGANPAPLGTAPSGDELFPDELPVANDAGPTGLAAPPVAPVGADPLTPSDRDGSTPDAGHVPSAAERLAAWTLASNWALVATQHTLELDPAQAKMYHATARAARDAGESLGIAAPPLATGDTPETLVAATVADLQTGAGPKLAEEISSRLGAAAGAAAQLAIRAHLLLLTYTPAGPSVWGDAAALRDAGVASGLPAELWRPLVEQLERRADRRTVVRAVVELRRGVATHLAE